MRAPPLQILDGDRGKAYPKRSEFTEAGHCVFLNTGNVTSSGFDFSSIDFISHERDLLLRKGKLERQDLVLTTRGTVGNVAFYHDRIAFDHIRINSGMVILRPVTTDLDPRFLYQFLRSRLFISQVDSLQTGSAQPQLPIRDIKKIKITIPELPEQKLIAGILSTLDDKIALNHQTNTSLESMAQALFKSWFVDFDPVIDNALAAGNPIPEALQARADARAALGDQRKPLPDHIRQQFPDRFVETEEMGWVPEGWEVGSFSDIAVQVRDNAKAEEIASDDRYVGLEHIGRKQFFISDHGYGDSVESNKSRFQHGDLLFGKLRPYFHKVCRAPFDGICSTDILVFRPKQPAKTSFMYMTAYRDDFVEFANACSTGTRMPRANAKDLLSFPVVIPAESVRAKFENLTASHWEKGAANVEENKSLSKLRDTLLPKLLSGELRIPEAEKQVEEAI